MLRFSIIPGNVIKKPMYGSRFHTGRFRKSPCRSSGGSTQLYLAVRNHLLECSYYDTHYCCLTCAGTTGNDTDAPASQYSDSIFLLIGKTHSAYPFGDLPDPRSVWQRFSRIPKPHKLLCYVYLIVIRSAQIYSDIISAVCNKVWVRPYRCLIQ